jgi:hypothetical protein
VCPPTPLLVRRDQTPSEVFPPFAGYSETWAGQGAQLGNCFPGHALSSFPHENFSQPMQAPQVVPLTFEEDALSFAHDAILSDVATGRGPGGTQQGLAASSWDPLLPWTTGPGHALEDGDMPLLTGNDRDLAPFADSLYQGEAVSGDLPAFFLPDLDSCEPDSMGAVSMSALTDSPCSPCPAMSPRAFPQEMGIPGAQQLCLHDASRNPLGDAVKLEDVLGFNGEPAPVGRVKAGGQGPADDTIRKRGRPRRYDIPLPTHEPDAGAPPNPCILKDGT